MNYWYLVQTKIRQENRALINLELQGFNCFLPLMRTEKLKRRVLVDVIEPLFPRYLFIQLKTDIASKSWMPIRSTLGVSQLVMFGNIPAKIDENHMAAIRSQFDDRLTDRPYFEPGQSVAITEGPFIGLQAVYQMASGESRVIVLLELMSKVVKLSLAPTSICKAT